MIDDKAKGTEKIETVQIEKDDMGKDSTLRTIGNYKLLEAIGEGGMGTVYLAQQEKPIRRKVALKIIKPGMNSREVIGRFESERQALALMSHPNIAQVFDAGETADGYPYFVMEYVPGIPITRHCDKYKLSTRDRLELFQKVCAAIQHAHFKGILHRDIKPSNVLVSLQEGSHVPKIIDFGIAKALTGQELTDKTVHTRMGFAVGTPVYMSPEQAEMTGMDIDTRTDIYSLGVLLYELLVGVTPFDRAELEKAGWLEILRRIREEEPAKPSMRFKLLGEPSTQIAQNRGASEAIILRQLAGDIDWIVMKALEKDRRRRYNSAADFAADISRSLNQEPVAARPPSIAYKTIKFVRRNKVLSMSLITILLLILAFSGWNLLERRRAERERNEANYNFALALKEKAIASAERREWPLMKLFLANAKFYALKAGRDITLGDIQIPFDYEDWQPKKTMSGFVSYILSETTFIPMAFSPDGKRLAAGDISGSIKIWDAETGAELLRIGPSADRIVSLCFSPDGKTLVSGRPLGIWNSESGDSLFSKEQIASIETISEARPDFNARPNPKGDIESVQISHSGKVAAFGRSDGLIKVFEMVSGKTVVILNQGDPVQSLFFSQDDRLCFSSSSSAIKVWDIQGKKEIKTIANPYETSFDIVALAVYPDGKTLVTAGAKSLKLINVEDGRVVDSKEIGYFRSPIQIKIDQGGRFIFLGTHDGTTYFWGNTYVLKARGLDQVACFPGRFVTSSRDGNKVATLKLTSNQDGLIKIWERRKNHSFSLRHDGPLIHSADQNPVSKELVTINADDKIEVWDLKKREKQKDVGLTEIKEIHWILFHPSGRFFAFLGIERGSIRPLRYTIYVYGFPSFNGIAVLKGDDKGLMTICFSNDGKYLASISEDYAQIIVWNTLNWQKIKTFVATSGAFGSGAFSPDGEYFAFTKNYTNEIKINRTVNWKEVASLKKEEGGGGLDFSNDGKYLLCSKEDMLLSIWNTKDWKDVSEQYPDRGSVENIVFSANSKFLASSRSSEGDMVVRNAQNFKVICTLKGNNEFLRTTGFSPDNRLLVSTGSGNRIDVFDMSDLENSIWYQLTKTDSVTRSQMFLQQIESETGLVLDGAEPIDQEIVKRLNPDYKSYGKFRNAMDAYSSAYNLYSMSKIKVGIGEFGKALDYIEKALSIRNEFPFAIAEKEAALIAFFSGNEKKFKKYMAMAVQKDPEFEKDDWKDLVRLELDNILDNIYGSNMDKAKKITVSEAISKHYPNDVDLNHEIGLMFVQDEDWQKGLQFFEKIVQANPDHAKGWQMAGFCLCRLKRYEEAIKALTRAVELEREEPLTWQFLCEYHFALRELDKAFRAANTALEINPRAYEVPKYKNISFIRQEGDIAVEMYMEISRLFPGHFSFAYSKMGWIRFLQGEFDEALEFYLAAIGRSKKILVPTGAIPSPDADIQFKIALTSLAAGIPGNPLDRYKLVMKNPDIVPSEDEIRRAIADLEFLLFNYPEFPQTTMAYLIRGYLYSCINEKELAEEELASFLEVFKGDRDFLEEARKLVAELNKPKNF